MWLGLLDRKMVEVKGGGYSRQEAPRAEFFASKGSIVVRFTGLFETAEGGDPVKYAPLSCERVVGRGSMLRVEVDADKMREWSTDRLDWVI